MPTLELHVQADPQLVERFCADFDDDEMIEYVEIRSTAPLRRDLLDREVHRQAELVDVIIAFVVNIISAAAYNAVRDRIRERAEARQLRVVKVFSTDDAPSALENKYRKYSPG